MKCGYDEPSNEESSYIANSMLPLEKEYQLTLKEDDSAILTFHNEENGRWTMVYDEGFDIQFNDFSFFAFSKYIIEPSSNGVNIYKSKCYSTLIGWYTNIDKTQRGCYKAIKMNVDPSLDTFITTKKQNLNIINSDSLIPVGSFSSFLESSERVTSKTKINFNFHAIYAKNLNRYVKNKNWKAGTYSHLHNKSLSELNKFAGMIRFKSLTTNTNTNSNSQPHTILQTQVNKLNFPNINLPLNNNFPLNFDWKHALKPSASQGDCGSCYTVSTLRMIEARLKILYNHDVNLSFQHALDCSYYNQGCNGGYPYLVMKFANEFELIPEHCQPYLAQNSKCEDSCDITKLPYIYKVFDYKYLGGSYGKCNEYEMMKELYENGPFVVSFEPDYNFMLYQSGVFHSVERFQNQNSPLLNKPEWEKVDHSVLLVGWGEDPVTGEKYWLVQNTWGPDWGENGFFRIRRGADESAIESICEAGTPIIVDNKTKLSLIADKKNRLPPGMIKINQGIENARMKIENSQIPTNLNSSILKLNHLRNPIF